MLESEDNCGVYLRLGKHCCGKKLIKKATVTINANGYRSVTPISLNMQVEGDGGNSPRSTMTDLDGLDSVVFLNYLLFFDNSISNIQILIKTHG